MTSTVNYTRARVLRHALWLVQFMVMVLVLAPGVTAQTPERHSFAAVQSEQPFPGAAPGWQAQTVEAIADSEYEISWQPTKLTDVTEAWQAPNRAHNFRTYFTDDGIRVIPRKEKETGPGWEIGLKFIGYGRGEVIEQPVAAIMVPDKKAMKYRRGQVIEWYENDRRGLEQGFTLNAPPGGNKATGKPRERRAGKARNRRAKRGKTSDEGPVYLALTLTGDLRPLLSADKQAIDFTRSNSTLSVARYGGLSVWDADGKELTAWMELATGSAVGGIRLFFDDTDARYPVTVDPLLSTSSWSAEGDQFNARFGFSVAGAGDVNGDGFADVIVGAPYYDKGQTDEGRVYLFHGSAAGIEPLAAWTAEGNQIDAQFGHSVAGAGDVNLDGYADILIGAPGYDTGEASAACTAIGVPYSCCTSAGVGDCNEGRILLYHGSATGPDSEGAPWCADTTADWCATVNQPEARFGTSVASAGNVDGEGKTCVDGTNPGAACTPGGGECTGGGTCQGGYDGIIASAPYYDNPQVNEGVALVYYGGTDGLTQLTLPLMLEGNDPGGAMGSTPQSVASAGDVNGDGYGDVIVGAPLWDDGQTNEGASFVWHGPTSSGPGWARVVQSGEINAYYGTSVAGVGDLNGDGFDDVVVGTPEYHPNDYGRAYVYHGSDSGIGPLSAWHVQGKKSGELLGTSVASAGDVNGDGVPDLIVGSPGHDNSLFPDQGRVELFLGPQPADPWDEAWQKDGNSYIARLGTAVAGAGDVNGDGWDDVIIGAPTYTGDKTAEGIAYVYHSARVSIQDLLLSSLGLDPADVFMMDAPGFNNWFVFETSFFTPLEQFDTPGAAGFGPIPGSIMISTGTVWDPLREPPGSTDWGTADPDKTSFYATINVPDDHKTLRFTTQFITGDEPGRDLAYVRFRNPNSGPAYYRVWLHDRSDGAAGGVHPPTSHAIDVAGADLVQVEFLVSDGADGLDDSALIISRMFFSKEPLPTDITDCVVEPPNPECPGKDWDNGLGVYYGNPAPSDVSLSAGTYSYAKSLLNVPGKGMPFDFSIFYNSGSVREGALGRKWTHSYESRVREDAPRCTEPELSYGDSCVVDADCGSGGKCTTDVNVTHGSGLSEYFQKDDSATCSGDVCYKPKFPGVFSSLEKFTSTPDYFLYVTKDQVRHEFAEEPAADPTMRLLSSITDSKSNTHVLEYDDNARLDYVLDTRGEIFTFNYDGSGRLTSVQYPEPGANFATIFLDYHALTGDLKSFTDLNGYTTEFVYDEAGNLLTGTDGDWTTFVNNRYEDFQGLGLYQIGNRVVNKKNANGGDAGESIEYDREALITRRQAGGREIRKFDVKGRLFEQETLLEETLLGPEWANSAFTYYADNKMKSRRDPLNNSTSMEYDQLGNLTCLTTDALGQKMAMIYDAHSNLRMRLTQKDDATPACPDPASPALPNDSDWFIEKYVYDGIDDGSPWDDTPPDNNLTAVTDPLGRTMSYAYTSEGQMESRTDARGNTFTHAYDTLGYPAIVTDPLLSAATYTYDAMGRRTSVTDPRNNTTSFEYDTGGRLLAETDALNHTVSYTYDAQGRVLTTTDQKDKVWHSTYTPTGLPWRSTDPLGNTTTYGYDAEDRLTTETDARLAATSYEYDAAGRLVKVTDPLGGIVRNTYDKAGNQTSVTDENNRTTVFEYDALRRVIKETDPKTHSTSYDYDTRGNVLTRTEHNLAIWASAYTDTGQLEQSTDPLLNITRYTYDAADQLTSVEDPINQKSCYYYDELGRMQGVSDPLADCDPGIDPGAPYTARAAYDKAGNRISVKNPNGEATTFGYDELGRMRIELDPLGHAVTTTYDERGMVDTTTNARNQTIDYLYDHAGRQTKTILPAGSGHITHTLDANGNPLSSADADNVFTDISRSFDKLDRPITRTVAFDASTSETVGTEYDAAGNLTKLTYSDDKQVSYEYDKLNRLKEVTDWNNDITEYTYDVVGNLEMQTLPDGSVVTYTYDLAHRLTNISGPVFSADFTLNAAGQRTRAVLDLPLEPTIPPATDIFTYNAADQIATRNGVAFVHDADGNLTQGVIGGGTRNLVYNALNQLTAMDGDTYRYDVDGLRVESSVGGETTRYVYDPLGRLLEEHDAAGNVKARYVHGMGLISREGPAGDVALYHYDSRGSTVALTDTNGAITDKYAYDPYGKVIGQVGTTPNPFTYVGKDGVIDDGNGLYYMRARYYAPELMRFVQKDPIYSGELSRPQSLNRYAYVEGDPIHRTDPEGEFWNVVAGAATGAAVGFGVSVASDLIAGREISWTHATGAAVEGAIAGVSIGTGGAGLAFGIGLGSLGGAAGNLTTQALHGKNFGNFDFGEVGNAALVGGAGGILGAAAGASKRSAAKAFKKFDEAFEGASIQANRKLQSANLKLLGSSPAARVRGGVTRSSAYQKALRRVAPAKYLRSSRNLLKAGVSPLGRQQARKAGNRAFERYLITKDAATGSIATGIYGGIDRHWW